jgi:hypothetical protein
MTGVAEAITDALRQIDTGLSCRFGSISDSGDSETLVLYIYHVLFYYSITVGSATGVGYDMFLAGNSCLATDNVSVGMGHQLNYLRYPEDNRMITHYSIYRSKDILPHVEEFPDITDPRLQNNPDTFALIEDVPACKVFTASVTGATGVMVSTEGFDIADVGNEVTTADGLNTFTVTGIVHSTTNTYTTDYSGLDIGSTNFYMAADDYCVINKTDNEITSSPGYTFTVADIGKVIFYLDGTISYITGINGSGNATTTDEVPKIAVAACLNPVPRVFYDTVSDVTQNAYLASTPLNMRFYDKLDITALSSVNSGILMTASDRGEEIKYCNTDKVYRIGYYNSAFQYNNNILRNITAIITVGDKLCVFTDIDTYSFNVKQGEQITTDYGESFFIVPEPIKLSGSIGLRNRQSWDYAMKDNIVMVTSEPAIRYFNGNEYGDNLADGSIQKTYIKKLANSEVVSYSATNGVTIWGSTRT